MTPQQDHHDENLMTPQALAMSLAPPRVPPHGTLHRNYLCNLDPVRHSHKNKNKTILTHHHNAQPNTHNGSYRNISTTISDHERNKRKGHSRRTLAKVQNHRYGNHHEIKNIVEKASAKANQHKHLKLPHPHLTIAPDSGDAITRWLGSTLPIGWQHRSRDDGTFRSISDNAVTMTVPSLAIINPAAMRRFLHLTNPRQKITFKYGSHKMQYVDLFLPPSSPSESESESANARTKGLVFFVHGGAWGSGHPWMYRLTATPFLEQSMAVAVVGYRTYPDGNVQDQVDDLETAAMALKHRYPHLCENGSDEMELGITLMGHSSGAHIAMLMAVQRVERCLDRMNGIDNCNDINIAETDTDTIQFDKFVGLSGVYDISHHFDYEAGRGVEELSPMKPACGYTRHAFDHHSPALRLLSLLSTRTRTTHRTNSDNLKVHVDEVIRNQMPDMLLIHGVEDATVPFTSTSEAAMILRSCGVSCCEERYMISGHPDVVMELMMEGRTRRMVMDWLFQLKLKRQRQRLLQRKDIDRDNATPSYNRAALISSKL